MSELQDAVLNLNDALDGSGSIGNRWVEVDGADVRVVLDELTHLQNSMTHAINVDIEKSQEVRTLRAELARLTAERRWIPVSQPPKETAKYYWCSLIDEYYKTWQDKRYLFFNGTWNVVSETVTHWMPLPLPPEGDA